MKSRLKLSLEIAVRFLLSKSRGNFLSFITIISIVGVSVGVLALLVVTSVVNGFENELSRVITGTQGEVLFYTRASPIRDREALEKKIREFAPGIEAMTGSFVSEVMFHGPDGVAGGVLEGVDLNTWAPVISVGERLNAGGSLPVNEGEILLGSALAEKLGVKVGEAIRVIIPFSSMEEDEDQGFGAPRVQDFKIVGIVHLGMYDYDSKYAYAPLVSVQRLVYGEDQDFITSFRIKLKNPTTAQAVGAELSQHFGFPYRVRDWSQLNRNLLYAIKLEKAVIAVLLTAIMVVAAFNVISALLMMVYEKEKEISILRVLGVRRRDHFILFAMIGSALGLAGTVAGVILGTISILILRQNRFIDLPAEVYHLEYLPVIIRWTEWCAIGVMAFVICFLATVGPAARIARRNPVEGLRWTT
ncbi:MAG: ABC transporter permease [Bdellovibrionales bacterium]|nr:ABC transporter permease [Bdellovibrionales bacterium]